MESQRGLRRRPEAVFLDAGNVLLLVDYSFLAELAAEAKDGLSPQVLERAEWTARVRLGEEVATGHPISTESDSLFRRYLVLTVEAAGLDLAASELERFLDRVYEYHQTHNLWRRPHPLAGQVLAELHGMGLRLAVVSNSDGRLEEALGRLGLARYFDSILDSAVVGVEKPHPEIFRIAAREVGVAPEQSVHVGDLYWIDVLGARAAAVEPVLLDPGGIWPQTDCVRISDLAAVPELVRRAPDFRGTIL